MIYFSCDGKTVTGLLHFHYSFMNRKHFILNLYLLRISSHENTLEHKNLPSIYYILKSLCVSKYLLAQQTRFHLCGNDPTKKQLLVTLKFPSHISVSTHGSREEISSMVKRNISSMCFCDVCTFKWQHIVFVIYIY